MKMVVIWNAYKSKKHIALAQKIVDRLTAEGVKAEVKEKGWEVQVWRDRKYEKRCI